MRARSLVVATMVAGWALSLLPATTAEAAPQIIVQKQVEAQADGAAALVDVTTNCPSGTTLPIDVTLYQGHAHAVAQATAYEVLATCDGVSHTVRIPVLLALYDPYYDTQLPSVPFAAGPGVVVLGAGVGTGTSWPVQISTAAPIQQTSSSLTIRPTATRTALDTVLTVAANVVCPASHRRSVVFDVAQSRGQRAYVNRFGTISSVVHCTGQTQQVRTTIVPSDRTWQSGPMFVGASLCQAGDNCSPGPPTTWRTITVK